MRKECSSDANFKLSDPEVFFRFDSSYLAPLNTGETCLRGLLVTQLEPDFKYAIRVTSASVNGVGDPSEPYYFWAGVLPTEPVVVRLARWAQQNMTWKYMEIHGNMLQYHEIHGSTGTMIE